MKDQDLLDVMNDVRKLLILDALDRGHKQESIANVLGMGRSTVSKLFPGGVPKTKG